MTNTELKAQIDSVITSQTADNSITPVIVGMNLKDVVDYAGSFKRIIVSLDQNGGTVTPTYFVNDFESETIEWTVPNSGVIRMTITNAVTVMPAANTFFLFGAFPDVGGVTYVPTMEYGNVPVLNDIQISALDGSQSSTPNFTKFLVEVRVYD